jgi:hypothetical protein
VGGVLVHYTDPFLLRSHPLRRLRQWSGPWLLLCGQPWAASPRRRELLMALQNRGRVPFRHVTTTSPE